MGSFRHPNTAATGALPPPSHGQYHRSQKSEVHSVSLELPVVMLFVCPVADGQVLGVDAQPIVTAVTDHIVVVSDVNAYGSK